MTAEMYGGAPIQGSSKEGELKALAKLKPWDHFKKRLDDSLGSAAFLLLVLGGLFVGAALGAIGA